MSQGVQARGAFRRDSKTEAVWPGSAPTAPGAGHGIPLRTENISRRKLVGTKGLLQGSASQERPTVVGWQAGGSILCDLRYGSLDRLWALALGFENPIASGSGGSPQSLGVSTFRHAYEADQLLENKASWAGTARHVRRGGLYVFKGGTSHRLWPAMVEGFTVSITPEDATVSFDLIGHDLTIVGGLDPTTWTPPHAYDGGGADKVTMPQTRVYLGVAPTLTEYFVRSLEITVRNGLKADDYRSGSLYIDEPIRTGMREVMMRATLSRYTNDVIRGHHNANQTVACLVDCTGGTLGVGNARLSFMMPAATVEAINDPVTGPGIITQDFEIKTHGSATIPTAWTTSGGPLYQHVLAAVDADFYIATQNLFASNVFEE